MHVEGDARLDFVRNGKKCNKKFLDAGVKQQLASVSAIVDGGYVVVFGPQDSYIENTSTSLPKNKRKKRVRGALGRTSGHENDENSGGWMIRTRIRFSGDEACTKMRKKFVNAVRPKKKFNQERKYA